MAEVSPSLECPVCNEHFRDPKLLQCNHVLCSMCLVDWLKKAGPQGGCPLCRDPILPSSSPTCPQDDLDSLVQALPTELTLVARVASAKLLSSSRHVSCMHCGGVDNKSLSNKSLATAFCLQCSMALCSPCAQSHHRFPAMRNHVVEELKNLSPEQLDEVVARGYCPKHEDRLVEVYCSAHQELLCLLCATTSHRVCPEVRSISEAAEEKREELSLEAQKLREKETGLRWQVQRNKDAMADLRTESNKVFDDLHQWVENRRQEVMALLQKEETKMALKQQDKVMAAMTSHAGVLENLAQSAPGEALLGMEKSVMTRVRQLEQQVPPQVHAPAEMVFPQEKLAQLKEEVSTLGHLGAPQPRTDIGLSKSSEGKKKKAAKQMLASSVSELSAASKPKLQEEELHWVLPLRVDDRVMLNLIYLRNQLYLRTVPQNRPGEPCTAKAVPSNTTGIYMSIKTSREMGR